MNSVPISPPVTPKATLPNDHEQRSPSEESLQLPPALLSNSNRLSPPPQHPFDLRRKSNARRYSKAMASPDKDTITFQDPFAVQGNFYLTTPTNRSKSIPQRSPSNTRGSFTMDIIEDIVGAKNGNFELSRKRRNDNLEERMTEAVVTQSQQQEQQPCPLPTSILTTERHVKKSKTDAAAAYDKVDIDTSDQDVFADNTEWIPDMNAFENYPHVRAVWKGSQLAIKDMPYYELLHAGEADIASTLRLVPEQYLKCRRSLILAAQEFDKMHIAFRKSDAQKCVRIDVNKTSALWSVFSKLGWFNPRSSSPASSTCSE